MLELPPVVAESDRLTASQALALGLSKNPQIALAGFTVRSARENYNSQKAPINPTVSYAALNNTVAPFSYANGFGLGSNYSLYATIETNGAIRYRTGEAREQYHQAQCDAAATSLSLKLGILSAYANLQAANRALEVELKVFDNIRKLSELTDRRFEIGAGPEADATRARIALIQEQQNVVADVGNVNLARAGLNAQLGRPQSSPIDAAEPLVYQPSTFCSLEELTKKAEADRPEVQSALANMRSLRSAVGLQRSEYFPDAVIGKDFGSDGQIYLGLTLPLDLGGIRGAVAKASADVKAQESQVEIARQSVDVDVKTSYINFVSAQKQVDTYTSGILQMSERLLDQVRHGYDLGSNSIIDIITTENTYRSVESAYYAAVGNYAVAVYTLRHSIGDLPDSRPSFSPLSASAPGVPALIVLGSRSATAKP